MLRGKNPISTSEKETVLPSKFVASTPSMTRLEFLPTPNTRPSPIASTIATAFVTINQSTDFSPMPFSWRIDPSEVTLLRMETAISGITMAARTVT